MRRLPKLNAGAVLLALLLALVPAQAFATTNCPVSIDTTATTLPNPGPNDPSTSAGNLAHHAQHDNENDAIRCIETYIGTNASQTAPVNGAFLVGGSGGSSSWTNATPAFSGPLTVTSNSANALAVGLNGATNPAFNIDSSVALQVNGVTVQGSATGNNPLFTASGGDTNIGINFSTKGSGNFAFVTDSYTATQFQVLRTASAVNSLVVTGAATGNRPSIAAAGSDSNPGLAIDGKGSGTVVLNGTTGTGGVTIGHGLTLTSGTTLTLTGDTVAGTPTWSSSQAITLSTAAQPNITSVGVLASPHFTSSVTDSGGHTITAGGLTVTAGNVGVLTAPQAQTGLLINGTLTGATTEDGLNLTVTGDSSGTSRVAGIDIAGVTNAASTTTTNMHGINIATNALVKGASGTVTNAFGININNQNIAVTTQAAGINIGAMSSTGTTNYGINIAGQSGASVSNISLNVGASSGTGAHAIQVPGGSGGYLNVASGGSTTISTGVGSVKMSTGNAATNTTWIPFEYAGNVVYVPGWATNAP